MPFFSVLIPLYNKEKFIKNTLQSILNQTFSDFEIIIVNDGSTDESEQIVLQFEDSRIRYYTQKNEGAASARNFGIDKANANYIAFIDADDLWYDNHLETLKSVIEEFPDAGIYASRYELVYKNKSTSVSVFNGLNAQYKGYVKDYFYSTQNNSLSLTLVTVIPKEVFVEIGNFNSSISSGQDIDMWARIALKYPVVIGNKITASYLHYIDDSLSKTSILKKKLIRFEDYSEYEKTNSSLKKYLDIYRMEYALQYKIVGANKESKEFYDAILKDNIPLKSKILYHFPKTILVGLLKFKRYLRNYGIDFSVYK
jgi:glycosyltransferase involved in cell wall biosynthesis